VANWGECPRPRSLVLWYLFSFVVTINLILLFSRTVMSTIVTKTVVKTPQCSSKILVSYFKNV